MYIYIIIYKLIIFFLIIPPSSINSFLFITAQFSENPNICIRVAELVFDLHFNINCC